MSQVGHDWGGRVVWGFLTLHPQRVLQAVILNAPHPVTMAKALMSDPRQLQKSWYIGGWIVHILSHGTACVLRGRLRHGFAEFLMALTTLSYGWLVV